MFFVDHKLKDGRLAVADTDDGVIDIVTMREYNDYLSQGIRICFWEEAKGYITGSMNRNCNYKLFRKLQRDCDERSIKEYLEMYSIYSISQKLNEYNTSLDLDRLCRVFDYEQTQGYFILALALTDNMTLLAILDDDYNMACTVINGVWHFEMYPSCSGSFLARLINKAGLGYPSHQLDEPYIIMYSQDLQIICLVSHYSITGSPIYLKNPERKILS